MTTMKEKMMTSGCIRRSLRLCGSPARAHVEHRSPKSACNRCRSWWPFSLMPQMLSASGEAGEEAEGEGEGEGGAEGGRGSGEGFYIFGKGERKPQ